MRAMVYRGPCRVRVEEKDRPRIGHPYRRHSEGRAAHRLLLLAADRIDVGEHVLRSFATLRPDNPLTQTGPRAELTHGGVRSRRGRPDVRHQVLDPVVNGAPWALGGYAAFRGVRRLVRASRSA